MQNVGVSNKEHYGVLLYFLEWSRTVSCKCKTMTSLPKYGVLLTPKYGQNANFRGLRRI